MQPFGPVPAAGGGMAVAEAGGLAAPLDLCGGEPPPCPAAVGAPPDLWREARKEAGMPSETVRGEKTAQSRKTI